MKLNKITIVAVLCAFSLLLQLSPAVTAMAAEPAPKSKPAERTGPTQGGAITLPEGGSTTSAVLPDDAPTSLPGVTPEPLRPKIDKPIPRPADVAPPTDPNNPLAVALHRHKSRARGLSW